MLECVVNVSEGRDEAVVGAIAAAGEGSLLDVHVDADHHRSVLTLAGAGVEAAARAVAAVAVDRLDLGPHRGVHPRIGVLDVVPFAPLDDSTMHDAIAARDGFAAWAGTTLDLPCFLYGPERSLPAVRRQAFAALAPHAGPSRPHPTAGACAVGARPVLVAYNVFLAGADLELARQIARDLRSPAVRALGLPVGGRAQVSMNLLDPSTTGPAEVYDAVAARARVHHAELVGLVPRWVLDAVPSGRWAELALGEDVTIEARLAATGS